MVFLIGYSYTTQKYAKYLQEFMSAVASEAKLLSEISNPSKEHTENYQELQK
jgi:hypothetical protein